MFKHFQYLVPAPSICVTTIHDERSWRLSMPELPWTGPPAFSCAISSQLRLNYFVDHWRNVFCLGAKVSNDSLLAQKLDTRPICFGMPVYLPALRNCLCRKCCYSCVWTCVCGYGCILSQTNGLALLTSLWVLFLNCESVEWSLQSLQFANWIHPGEALDESLASGRTIF